jgi:hypothetical protein
MRKVSAYKLVYHEQLGVVKSIALEENGTN